MKFYLIHDLIRRCCWTSLGGRHEGPEEHLGGGPQASTWLTDAAKPLAALPGHVCSTTLHSVTSLSPWLYMTLKTLVISIDEFLRCRLDTF